MEELSPAPDMAIQRPLKFHMEEVDYDKLLSKTRLQKHERFEHKSVTKGM
jgi:hypothetical protein